MNGEHLFAKRINEYVMRALLTFITQCRMSHFCVPKKWAL